MLRYHQSIATKFCLDKRRRGGRESVRLRNSHGRQANREEVKMQSTILLRQLICLHLIILFIVSAGHLSAQTEEKLLDDINQLPEAERQTRLVNGAKKESTVTWYVAMNRAYAQDLINAFETQYPFLKVNALTGGGGSLLNKVLTEYRARSYLYDVLNTRSMTINTLKKAGAIMRYRTPYRTQLRESFYDKEGF